MVATDIDSSPPRHHTDHDDESATTPSSPVTESGSEEMSSISSPVSSARSSDLDTPISGPSKTLHGARTAKSPGASPSSSSLFAWLLSQYTTQWVIPPAYAPAALQICITAFPLGVLFGLVLPRVFAFLVDGSLYTAVARLLMQTQAAQQQQLEGSWWCFPQLSIYLLAWSLFHLLEFTVTAAYNPTRLYSDSFLLNNGIHYHVAHVVALIEFAVTASVVPSTKRPGILTLVGLLLVVFGQVFRSGAMIHASKNFSHIVADKKRQDHELVTTGVYAWVRHPSYVGFFYWALGTQLLLGNVVATLGFVVTLYKFFSNRIRAEERYLVEFFGDQYRLYRKTTGSGLPFIK